MWNPEATQRDRLRPGARQGQQGLSIVELMVALAIALFLLAGISSVFLGMKRSFVAQDRLSELQDNQRLALNVLTATVQAAGYFPDPLNQTVVDALPAESGSFGTFAPGQGVVGTSTTVSTRYLVAPGEPLTDCLGRVNKSAAPVRVVNTYSIGPGKELRCTLDGGATHVTLVGGVTAMSALYGTSSLSGGAGVDRYLDADEITAAGLWPQVRSVRMVVRFANPYAGQPHEPETLDWVQTINLMNRT